MTTETILTLHGAEWRLLGLELTEFADELGVVCFDEPDSALRQG
ncbi:hypothetical protein ACFWRT_33180 [Streptomyces cyaneofuscatus]